MKDFRSMSLEEFYNLDEVEVGSWEFTYVNKKHGVGEKVEIEIPEELLDASQEEGLEWPAEYEDHMHEAWIPYWEELKEKVAEAYEEL